MTEDRGLILLIEDEPQMRRFLRVIRKGNGYRLVEAGADDYLTKPFGVGELLPVSGWPCAIGQ